MPAVMRHLMTSTCLETQLLIDTTLLTPGRTRSIEAGSHLFRQGDAATAIFLIEAGCLRLERTSPDGRTVVLHRARAGDLFAEAALFSEYYHCDAVAQCDSRVRVYDKSSVLAGLDSSDSGRALVAFMARQLQQLRQRLELRNVRSASARVLLFLESRADDHGHVHIAGTLQNIAEELGLTREALYRVLASLKKEGQIERGQDCITLLRTRRRR